MLIKDFSLKKKYSHIRFGYEISALLFIIFLITCFDRKINALELILFLSSLIFLIFSLFKFNILIKIQFIFNKFFFLISKIINPILMVIVYFISIIPMALLFKIIKIFKKKETNSSYWKKEDKNLKKINFDEQF